LGNRHGNPGARTNESCNRDQTRSASRS
jgi:hypothetical protein